MKRFWVFLCIIVATVSVFGGFSNPEKLFAVDGDYNYFYDQTTPLFTNGINALTQVRTTQNETSNPRKATITANIDKFITIVGEVERTYTATFNQSKTANISPAKTQIAALNASLQKYQTLLTALPTAAQNEPTAKAVINTFIGPQGINGLLQQANQIDRNVITAGGVAAGSLVNAGAVTQAGSGVSTVVTNNNESPCTLGFWPGESFNLGTCINNAVVWIIKNTLLQIATFLVWITANIFNYAVQIGILQFSKWAPDTLYPIWIIVRQILSLLIVFVGLYLGFMYILGKEDKFEKYIPWVVIFALFVNFSYPIARTAIDVSNIISLNIYASAVGNDALTNTDIFSQNTAGAVIMNKLGLQGLTASALSIPKNGGYISNINSIPGSLLAVAFVFYAAYIFFMVAGIIVMRTAILVFLTIASPILLVDSVLPLLGEQAKKLRKMFFEQLAVGPVFMIMLALTMKFLEVFSSPNGPIGAVNINTTSSGAESIKTFFGILMMLIMLHIMIKVTKSISGTAGEYATNFMGKVGGFGLGVATGGAGLLARQSIGRGAARLQNHEWVRNNKDTALGRMANRITGSIATSTFDLRNSSVVANNVSKIPMGKALLGGMGSGQQGGYIGAIKRREAYDKEAREGMQVRYKQDTVDEDGTIHKSGEIDDKASAMVKSKFSENRSNSIFMTKEQKLKIRDEEAAKRLEIKMKEYSKLTTAKKAEELEKMKTGLEAMKKIDKELDSVDAIVLQKSIASIEQSNKLKDKAGTIFSDALSEYKKFDDSPAGKTKKQAFFGEQTDEIKEYIQSKDQEAALVENKKIIKETTDKQYKEDMLQAQKDLATAQKETAEILKSKQVAPESVTPTTPTPPAVAQAQGGATTTTYAIPTSYNVTNPQSIETINFSDFAKARRLKNTDTTSLDEAGLVPKEGEQAAQAA